MNSKNNCRHPVTGVPVILAVLVAVTAGCGRPKPSESARANGSTTGGVAVTVEPAFRRDISKVVDVTGSLVPLHDVIVGPRQAGRIVSVHVREGDRVTQGQIVATMDRVDHDAQVRSARANLQAALTREAQANALVTQATNQHQQAETNLRITDRSTQAGLQAAKAAVQSAEAALAVIRQGARPQEREQISQQVRAAKANLDKATADLKRARDLFAQQAIAQSQLDLAQAAYDAADASYRAALQTQSLTEEGARKEDVRRAELAVEQARESLRQAEANREAVELRRQDVRNAQEALRSAKAGAEAARAGVEQARATLAMAENALADTYVASPIDGYVAARLAEPGQQVGAGAPILRLVAPGSVYFQASVPESEYSLLAVGQPVEVTVDALPGVKFQGRVSRVFPVASSAARSFTVRVDFQGDGRVRPQMFARGRIVVGVHRNATLVSKDAILFGTSDSDATLFVVGPDKKAEERKLTLGFINTEHVEVLSGVKPGEKVVVAGQNTLRNGDPVVVR